VLNKVGLNETVLQQIDLTLNGSQAAGENED
jgi:hypothetical protein